MVRGVRGFVVAVLAAGIFCASAAEGPATDPPLKVGIFDRPPFAMKDATGKWTGLAVEVWERVSAPLGLRYEYVETPGDRIIDELAEGRLDLAMGELAVSPDRARRVEFSQPFFSTSAAVAVRRDHATPHWFDFTRDVLAHGVGSLLLVLLGSLLLFGLTLWLVERRVDRSHFGGHPVRGFGAALWFAAVTMTTVGYGDKTPQSPAGRMVVFFWMFAGVVLISVFTGAIASSLAVSRVETRIAHASDLSRYRPGVMAGSLSASVLRTVGVTTRAYPTVEAGLAALAQGREITAFADAEATLRFLVNRDYPGAIMVEPLPTTHLSYAFAARPGFPVETQKAINVGVIEQVMRPEWTTDVERWLGPPAR